jgi:WD40 repeat protein
LRGHSDVVNALAFSSDGLRLASVSYDMSSRVWNSARGQEVFNFRDHTRGVAAASWSPDANRLATAGRDDTVRVCVGCDTRPGVGDSQRPLGGGEQLGL